jgi:hypothetical protein
MWRAIGHRDQVVTADAAVGRIEHDPASAGNIDFCPGVRRSGAGGAAHIEIGIVQVTRYDPRAETEAAHGIDEQHREIAA